MHRELELITFQKNIAPGVSVRIDGVPASILGGEEKCHAFDTPTAYRLEHFLAAARRRMANGETEIRFDFSDTGAIAAARRHTSQTT
jgi:hypothetical protein